MEAKRSFYGRVSSAILAPPPSLDADDQATAQTLRPKRFSYGSNSRLLDINTADISAKVSGTGTITVSPTSAGPVPRAFQYNVNPEVTSYGQAVKAERGETSELPPDNRECVICADEKLVGDFARAAAGCDHDPLTCRDCVTTSIRSDMDNKRWTEMSCPECEQRLGYTDVHQFADTQTFERYETLVVRAAMEGEQNFRWCPCGSGQVHESGASQPIMTCLHCKAKRCFRHEEPWHQGMSCKEYDELLEDPENFRSKLELGTTTKQEDDDNDYARRLLATDEEAMRLRKQQEEEERRRAKEAADVARQIAAQRKREEERSVATLTKTTKPCPQCAAPIEKNKGCSHITCRCGYEFCFQCGADHRKVMESDNSVHEKTCPFHSDNLGASEGAR